ncbi:MAG: hypothetical protein AB7O57_10480 [Hyphomicrobiaceae bacterium]
MMRAAALLMAGLSGAWLASAPALAEPKPVKLSAGLEASVGFCGRSKEQTRLTVTMKLVNKGSAAVHMLLADAPLAIDNGGGSYKLDHFSGIAQCTYLSAKSIADCIGLPKSNSYTVPLQSYTQLDPGSETTVTFTFASREPGKGTLCSFAATMIYRLVHDPLVDATLPEEQKLRSVRTLNISIPEHPITDGR